MRYDIFNPTQAGRVIYDGIDGQQRKITVLPGETKRDVELADHIAAGFNYAPSEDKSDLVLTPLDQPPMQPKPLPADYVRYEAPPIEQRPLSLEEQDLMQAALRAGTMPVRPRESRRRRVAGSIIED